jgi:hypothetical protein
MKTIVLTSLKVMGFGILGLALVYSFWEPVLPSRFLIQGMAKRIDPQALPDDGQTVVCFDLSGKGGGVYSLLVRRDGVDVVEGETDQADLILFMKARNFNNLILSLARGQADGNTFIRLTTSKVLRFSGDMGVLELIFGKREADEQIDSCLQDGRPVQT